MSNNDKINYLEFPAKNILATKAFFETVFAWSFVDYGPDYASFSASDAGLDGGFFKSDLAASTDNGSALVVLYSDALEEAEVRVREAGCVITKPIFSFPGGRRFHFTEPSGNELAVWSDIGA